MAATAPVSPIARARTRDTDLMTRLERLTSTLVAAEQRLTALAYPAQITAETAAIIARAVIDLQHVRAELPTLVGPLGTTSA